MELFEFLVVAFALLYASAAMRLIGGLPAALNPARRYWVHVGMIIVTLLIIAFNFWTFWSLNTIEWTLPRFIFALLVPSLLYFCASALVPENPADVTLWTEYYESIRIRYFGGLALWVLVLSAISFVLLDLPLFHRARIGHLFGLAVAILGMTIADRRVHVFIVVSLMALVTVFATVIGAEPAWLVR